MRVRLLGAALSWVQETRIGEKSLWVRASGGHVTLHCGMRGEAVLDYGEVEELIRLLARACTEQEPVVSVTPLVRAAEGPCVGCGDAIQPGQLYAYGGGGPVHINCRRRPVTAEEKGRAVLRAVITITDYHRVEGVRPFHVRYFGIPECVTDVSLSTIARRLRWLEDHGYAHRTDPWKPGRAVARGRWEATEKGRAWVA